MATKEEIIGLANSIIDATNALSVQPTSPAATLTWPTPTDCLAGTPPAAPWPYDLASDPDAHSVDLTYYDRMHAAARDGSVLFIGHSQIQQMDTASASPFGVAMGYGGETFRRLMVKRLNRLGSGNLIHRAGAVVLLSGVCDIGSTTYYGAPSTHQAADTVANLMYRQLAGWATGKWVIVKCLPIDEFSASAPGYNAEIDRMNAGIVAAMAATTANVRFVDIKSQVIDSDGNLRDDCHIGDGVHLSKLSQAILTAGISAALQSLGVQ